MTPGEGARAAAETALRDSYGRLLALVTRRTRDIAAAEDALSDAFAAALRTWPDRGIPDRPEAWLLTAARRAAGAQDRRGRTARAAQDTLTMIETLGRQPPDDPFPDDRLRLLFTCAHPAIDPAARTPLMLQTVLGLDAARIAAAFATSPAAMSQRLVRAKTRIRDAGIPFSTPEPPDLPDRLGDVLAAIYAAFGTGWDALGGAEDAGHPLTAEAIWLARLTIHLLPDEPEPMGLLSLMLHATARRAARRDASGAYVPLSDQDRALWDTAMIAEAEALLTRAAAARRFGRFQSEAAIQSLHAATPRGARPDARALTALYDALALHHPALGVLVARAVAHGDRDGPAAGLRLLDAIAPERAAGYQPYWAARLSLARAAGQDATADMARRRAMALTADPAVAAWLATR